MDAKALAAQAIDTIKGYVERQLSPLVERIKALEARQPERGADGKDGRDGKDGAPGAQGPQGPRGEKGQDGADGKDGAPGRDGKDGKDGRDGIAGPVGPRGEKGDPGPKGDAGAPGRDGKDGVDGVTMDSLDLVQEGRSVLVKCRASGRLVGRLHFPIPIYRGVFKDGTAYEAGDMVTHGGSVWHCNGATTAKPGDGELWTLSVKRGRDGRDMAREAA